MLPDIIVLPLIPAGLLVAWAVDPGLVGGHALGALAGFAAFSAIAGAYRRAGPGAASSSTIRVAAAA